MQGESCAHRSRAGRSSRPPGSAARGRTGRSPPTRRREQLAAAEAEGVVGRVDDREGLLEGGRVEALEHARQRFPHGIRQKQRAFADRGIRGHDEYKIAYKSILNKSFSFIFLLVDTEKMIFYHHQNHFLKF